MEVRMEIDVKSYGNTVRVSKFKKNCDVVAYYQSIFNLWDHNRDGYISISELKRLVATTEDVNLTKEAINLLFSRFDANNDELLDFEEFLIMVNHPTFKTTFRKIARKYLKYVIVPAQSKKAVRLRRTVTNTGAYEKEIKFRAHTVGMLIISAVQIIIHHINYSLWEDKSKSDDGPIGNKLRFDPDDKEETYRYISYLFVHSVRDSHSHLYFNVLFQLLLGVPLEMVHSWRLILVYFIGGVGGSLTHSVFSRGLRTMGASGAAYSFVAAHIATVLLNWREMSHPMVSMVLFGIIVIFDVGYQFTTKYILKMDGDDISYSSHLGGFITGFLLGILILRNLRVTSKEKIMWNVCFVFFIIFFGGLISADVILTYLDDDD